ncbi:MAG: response regulator [Desulfamplus sp.]|nr:response regulator [Desulfamplus sp.]
MITLLLISTRNDALVDLSSGLKKDEGIEIIQVESGLKALDQISKKFFDLVISDETTVDITGLEFAKKLLQVSPATNCAIVSPLSSKEFHEASEGLGILMQLPVRPDEKQAEALLKHLKKILLLTNKR